MGSNVWPTDAKSSNFCIFSSSGVAAILQPYPAIRIIQGLLDNPDISIDFYGNSPICPIKVVIFICIVKNHI